MNDATRPWLAALEGYYGPPLAHDERVALVQWLGEHDYDSYAYSPAPRAYYGGDPSSYYAPTYAYPRSYRTNGPAREDHLTGTGAGFID